MHDENLHYKYKALYLNMQIVIIVLLLLIIIKLFFMSAELEQIKADLLAAKDKVTKVAADVSALHAKIDGIGDVPTPEEWAEVKALSADLNTSLQAVDDSTPDA